MGVPPHRKADTQITHIKEQATSSGEHLRERLSRLEQALLSYAEYNKDNLFIDRPSVILTYGRLGFHRSIKLSIKNNSRIKKQYTNMYTDFAVSRSAKRVKTLSTKRTPRPVSTH